MVQDNGILRFISGIFNSNNPNSIWSLGSGSVSENEFQNAQLFKFTEASADRIQQDRILQTLNFTNTLTFLDNKRQAEINFIDEQIRQAKAFRFKPPVFRGGRLSRSVADVLAGKSPRGSGGFSPGSHNARQLESALRFRQQFNEFKVFKQEATEQIGAYVSNLTEQRGLLESRSFV